MTVTLRDVAGKAGVSVKTVSRVINNQGEISDSTRLHVLGVINELGYKPNTLARSLVSGKSSTVALIIPQITDPFFPEVMLGVEAVARAHGYNVFLCNTDDDPQQELKYVDILAGKRVDGIILCGSRLNAQQLSEVARQHRVSILTSRNPQGSAVISIPGEEGLFAMTSHLIGLGHRQIGHIGWWTVDEQERLQGYKHALTENNLLADDHWVVRLQQVSIDSGYEAAKKLLRQAPEITGLTCYNDLVAIGVLRACAELGLRVPDDLAVVGFDDIPLASLVTPALTTMHVPRYRLGEMVMELLLRVIAADGELEERLKVEVNLVVRDSCGGRQRVEGCPPI